MSAFVPGYKYDICVSYAHVDNEPFPGLENGWVSTFVEGLKVVLSQKLGTKGFSLWMDNKSFRGNDPFERMTLDAKTQSATMVIILSEGYVRSEWCRKE